MRVQRPYLKLDVNAYCHILSKSLFSNHSTSEAKFQEIPYTCFKFHYCEMTHCDDTILSLLMKRDSRLIQGPRKAFVFIREVGSYWNLNAGRRRAVLCRRGVGSYSRDCLLISVPDFPRALLLSYESLREVSTAKSIQLYKVPGLHQYNYKNEGTPHGGGWEGAVNWVVFCPRIWEDSDSNLGRNICYSDSCFVVS